MQAFEQFLNQMAEEFKKTANGWDSFAAYTKSPHTRAITVEDWNNLIGLMGHTDAYVRALRPVLEQFGPSIVSAIVEVSRGNFIDRIEENVDAGTLVFVMKDGSKFVTSAFKGPKGDPFTYEDFTAAQLEALRGPKGNPFTYADFTQAQIESLRGPRGYQGDPFRYEDFTKEQLEALRGPQGNQGEVGPAGKPFQASRVYSSIAEMNTSFDTDGVQVGEYVIISTPDVNDPDNSKVYVKTETRYNFLTDMSGKEGIQGPQGIQGIQGPAPVRGIDYWTQDDIATIREYVNLSILEGRW